MTYTQRITFGEMRQVLLLVAERNGAAMLPRIAVMKALKRRGASAAPRRNDVVNEVATFAVKKRPRDLRNRRPV